MTSPTAHPLSVAYRQPVLRDDMVQALLGIGPRQIRNLVNSGKLERAGDAKFHRITSASMIRYIGLPTSEPADFSPWDDLQRTDSFSRKYVETIGSDRKTSAIK